MKNSGYSKTPLEKKLGLKEGFILYLLNSPEEYSKWIKQLPFSLSFSNNSDVKFDFIHIFCTSEKILRDELLRSVPLLKQNGMLWVSWPKGSSKISSTINRESVRSIVLETGLVDIKVAAINEDWSGLKFVIRKKNRH